MLRKQTMCITKRWTNFHQLWAYPKATNIRQLRHVRDSPQKIWGWRQLCNPSSKSWIKRGRSLTSFSHSCWSCRNPPDGRRRVRAKFCPKAYCHSTVSTNSETEMRILTSWNARNSLWCRDDSAWRMGRNRVSVRRRRDIVQRTGQLDFSRLF